MLTRISKGNTTQNLECLNYTTALEILRVVHSTFFFSPEYPTKLLNQSIKIHTYNNIVSGFFLRWRLQDYLMNPLPFKSEKMKPRKGKSHNTTQYIKQKIPVPHDTALSSNTTE